MSSKVAVVTGANKGIGFAIVRGLCKRFEGVVYLTARDEERGKNAVADLKKEALRDRLKDEKLTVEELSSLMQQFVDAAKQGTHAADWGNSSYVVSKVGVTALSNVQQRLLNDRDIKVNSVHPGYVATDMSSHKGPMSIDEGAIATVYLALDAPDSVKGKFVWYNKEIVDWAGEKPKSFY